MCNLQVSTKAGEYDIAVNDDDDDDEHLLSLPMVIFGSLLPL
jgi:hypothetical protein